MGLHPAFLGVLNGIFGDYLHQRQNGLSIATDFYVNGYPLKDGLSGHLAKSPVSRPIAVFLHGAADSEAGWHRSDRSIARRLVEDGAVTPLYVRYNSGKSIAVNGRELSDLLMRLRKVTGHRQWLVFGHSMGGLVFRSAGHYALENRQPWTARVKKVFYLASPHGGAPLEKLGASAEELLRAIPVTYTRIAADLIGLRSTGIKDLQHGKLTDEPVVPKADGRISRLRQLRQAEHYLIAATWHSSPDSLWARMFGDGMVRPDSALATRGPNALPDHHHRLTVTGHSHVGMLASDEVYAFVKDRLGA